MKDLVGLYHKIVQSLTDLSCRELKVIISALFLTVLSLPTVPIVKPDKNILRGHDQKSDKSF